MSNNLVLSEFKLNEPQLFEDIMNNLLFLKGKNESNIISEELKELFIQINTEEIFHNLIKKYADSEKQSIEDISKSKLEIRKFKSILSDFKIQMTSSNFSFVVKSFEKYKNKIEYAKIIMLTWKTKVKA